jgi:hypothetical protein
MGGHSQPEIGANHPDWVKGYYTGAAAAPSEIAFAGNDVMSWAM